VIGRGPPVLVDAASVRHDRLDALRGAAIVWMIGFHFCFDLTHVHLIRQNFYTDPFWTVQRICIVSLFLFCAGMGQSVALTRGQGWPRFWRRWAQVAGCALLVTGVSVVMFPRSFITFGVLHGMAVMLLIARLTAPWGAWLWPLGALAVLLPLGWQHPFFDSRATNWVGLVTHKPFTEDYVPLLPWLGVMWWGLAAGRWLQDHAGAWLSGALPSGLRPLAWLGGRPLSVYMVHQPVLMGLAQAIAWVRGA